MEKPSTCMDYAGPNPDPPLERAASTSPSPGPAKDDQHLDSIGSSVKDSDIPSSAVPAPVIGPGPPPDGGREAWLNVVGTFFLMFASFGFITSFGQFEAYYLQNQLSGYSKPDVAWIGSLQLFITFAASLPVGRWFDSHGMRVPAICATIFMTGSLVAVAFCTQYYQFLLAHLLYGLGCGAIFSPCVAIPGHWFDKKRPAAMGIVVSGTGIGGVIYPIMFAQLFQKTSFRNALLAGAGLNFVILMPTIFIVKARLPPKGSPPWSNVLRPFRFKDYLFLDLGVALAATNLFTPFLNAPILVSTNHLPADIATYAVAILQTGSITGRLSAGFIAGALGVWPTFLGAGIGGTLVLLAFWIADTRVPGTIIGLWGFGHFNGMWITMIGICCAAVTVKCGRLEELGMRLGLMFTLNAIPMLLGPVISGVIVSHTPEGSYKYGAIFAAATLLVGTFLAVSPWIGERLAERSSKRETTSGDSS